MAKKIILLIVEGPSEVTALAMPLRSLLKRANVEFQIVGTDITSRTGVNPQNIKEKLRDEVFKFLKPPLPPRFREEDLIEVLLVTDMDGAYIPPEAISEDAAYQKAFYTQEHIFHEDRNKVILPHESKQKNLDTLIPIKKLTLRKKTKKQNEIVVPFRVYYFSCNLDHALYNEQNLPDKEKVPRAEIFELMYGDNPDGLLSFFEEIAVPCKEFYDSWDYIKQGLNSLQRGSNFHVYLKGI